MIRRLVAAALLLALGGCGGPDEDPADARVPGRTLTVYASLPRQGDSARQAAAVAAGARLALERAGARAGTYAVRLVELDSSDPEAGRWDPARVAANADRAADDPTTIAYLGELDFGGSAVSVPITNREGILTISPGDGLTSLTRTDPGRRTGPERYYPSGRRTFLRLVPIDLLQASALVEWARSSGARSVATVSDQSLFGRELAAEVVLLAGCQGLRAVASEEASDDPEARSDLAARLEEVRADAVVYTGGGGTGGPLLSTLGRALPAADLFAAGGIAGASTARDSRARDLLGEGAQPKGRSNRNGVVRLSRAPLPADAYPRAGRQLLDRIARASGTRDLPTDALYGYEAMSVVLEAVERAGEEGGDRLAVVEAALEPGARSSPLGRYRIDDFGDVDEKRFAGYRSTPSGAQLAGIRRAGVELAPPAPKLERPPSPCKELRGGLSESAGGN